MDDQNKPVEPKAEAASPAASDKGAARWGLILLALSVAAAVLVVGVLALQLTEYRFYKASPNVWPPRRPAAGQGATLPQTWQPGAGGAVSAPAAFIAPAAATTVPSSTAISAVPVAMAATASSETMTSSGVTSMPAVAATSAPAPAAATP